MKTSQEFFQTVGAYLNNDYIERLLQKRLNNNENEIFLMSAEELKKTMNLDEYFYRLMCEKNSNLPNSSLNKYLSVISRQLQMQPLLLLELPINKLDRNTLNYYLPNYNYVIRKISELETEANNIYRKLLLSPNNITYQELSKLTKFFSYNLPYNYTKMYKAMEQVAKFLLNNQKDTLHNYTYAVFLIKFFGYKKIHEDKLNDTQIIIGKLNQTTYGESTENYAIVNKELLQTATMENNTLEDKFGQRIKKDKIINGEKLYKVTEILGILHTLYHEIRHQKQKQHSENFNLDDLSYYYAAYEIINKNSEFDYKTNYKSYEIEKDANYYAWEDIEKLIKTYMPTHNLERTMKNILGHKLKEELEQITGIRTSKDKQIYLSNILLAKYLDEKIKDNPYI